MMAGDPMMTRILEAIALYQRGDLANGVAAMRDLWAETSGDGDPLHRCALAHYLADLEDDPAKALAWNRIALGAADDLSRMGVEDVLGGVPLQSFFPSLHLNLAEDYRLLGDVTNAARHARLAREALQGLPDQDLTAMIRGGVDRIEQQLGSDR